MNQPKPPSRNEPISADFLNRVTQQLLGKITIRGATLRRVGSSLAIDINKQIAGGDIVYMAKITAKGTTGDGWYQAKQIAGVDTSATPPTPVDMTNPLVWDGATTDRHLPEAFEEHGLKGLPTNTIIYIRQVIDQNNKTLWAFDYHGSEVALVSIIAVGSAVGQFIGNECDASGTEIDGGRTWDGGTGTGHLPEIKAPGGEYAANHWYQTASFPQTVVVELIGGDWVIVGSIPDVPALVCIDGKGSADGQYTGYECDTSGTAITNGRGWYGVTNPGDLPEIKAPNASKSWYVQHKNLVVIVEKVGTDWIISDTLGTHSDPDNFNDAPSSPDTNPWDRTNQAYAHDGDKFKTYMNMAIDDDGVHLFERLATFDSLGGLSLLNGATEKIIGGFKIPSSGTGSTRTKLTGHVSISKDTGNPNAALVQLLSPKAASINVTISGTVLGFDDSGRYTGITDVDLGNFVKLCSGTPADKQLIQYNASSGCWDMITPVTQDFVTNVTLDAATSQLTQTKKTATVIDVSTGTDSYIDPALVAC